MYYIKIQSYIATRGVQWRDTNQLIQLIQLPNTIPFPLPFQRGWLPLESLPLFVSPAHTNTYIYTNIPISIRFRFRSQRASNNTEERWCQAFATAYHGQSRKLECATRMCAPPSTCQLF